MIFPFQTSCLDQVSPNRPGFLHLYSQHNVVSTNYPLSPGFSVLNSILSPIPKPHLLHALVANIPFVSPSRLSQSLWETLKLHNHFPSVLLQYFGFMELDSGLVITSNPFFSFQLAKTQPSALYPILTFPVTYLGHLYSYFFHYSKEYIQSKTVKTNNRGRNQWGSGMLLHHRSESRKDS